MIQNRGYARGMWSGKGLAPGRGPVGEFADLRAHSADLHVTFPYISYAGERETTSSNTAISFFLGVALFSYRK